MGLALVRQGGVVYTYPQMIFNYSRSQLYPWQTFNLLTVRSEGVSYYQKCQSAVIAMANAVDTAHPLTHPYSPATPLAAR